MNKTEHLLICIMEECAEIQQACAKALRFGLDDGHPDRDSTNADDIIREYADLQAVIQMLLESESCINLSNLEAKIEKKKQKVNDFMKYAESRGTLKDQD